MFIIVVSYSCSSSLFVVVCFVFFVVFLLVLFVFVVFVICVSLFRRNIMLCHRRLNTSRLRRLIIIRMLLMFLIRLRLCRRLLSISLCMIRFICIISRRRVHLIFLL